MSQSPSAGSRTVPGGLGASLQQLEAQAVDLAPLAPVDAEIGPFAELLSKPSVEIDVSDFGTPELNGLAKRLMQLVVSERAYGLSAVQIGFPARVFVIGLEAGADVFCNPAVVSHGRDVETADEGCLSLRGVVVPVRRWRVITAAWSDLDGNPRTERLAGLRARVFQHELDHLNGVVITDDNAGVPEDS